MTSPGTPIFSTLPTRTIRTPLTLKRSQKAAAGFTEPQRADVPCDLSGAEYGGHRQTAGQQRVSGVQHRAEVQLPAGKAGLPAGGRADELPAFGTKPGGNPAGADYFQHRHLYPFYHPGAFPERERGAVLRHQRPVQQPYHGGPQEAEKPQRPDFRHSRLRQVLFRQAGNRQLFSAHHR